MRLTFYVHKYIAACEAAQELVWYKKFINELNIPTLQIQQAPLFIDNNAALKLSRNPEFHDRTKHIEMKFHYLRRMVLEGHIDTRRIGTKDNLADIFTKPLGRADFERIVEKLGMVKGSEVKSYSPGLRGSVVCEPFE